MKSSTCTGSSPEREGFLRLQPQSKTRTDSKKNRFFITRKEWNAEFNSFSYQSQQKLFLTIIFIFLDLSKLNFRRVEQLFNQRGKLYQDYFSPAAEGRDRYYE